MSKVTEIENWDFSAVPLAERVAHVMILVVYPEVSAELLALAPKERKEFITRAMRAEIDTVLAANKLANWKLLRAGRPRNRYHGISGEINVADIQEMEALAAIQSIQVRETNGKKKRLIKPRKKPGLYCVKMTVAILIEGHRKGRQSYEERYVLFKGFSEAEVLRKAKAAALAYQHSYLNSDDLLVSWQLESLDAVYEVVLEANAKELDAAEVFSVLKTRPLPK